MGKFKDIAIEIQQREEDIARIENDLDNLQGQEFTDAESTLVMLIEELDEIRAKHK